MRGCAKECGRYRESGCVRGSVRGGGRGECGRKVGRG